MITLSYGFQLPQTGDKGSSLFTGLEANITQINSHNHDGVNSAPISAIAIQSSAGIVPNTAWVSSGGAKGEFRQIVTMPGGFLYDKNTISFRLNGDYVYPKLQKIADTVFYVYTNDPTVTYQVVYGG
jgi:hypothetical protein